MLVWAGTGLTGLCLADLPPENGIDLLCQWTGRTWPSACNNMEQNFSLQMIAAYIGSM